MLCRQGFLHWITITVAVVLPHAEGGDMLCCEPVRKKEVITMIDVGVMINIVILAITAVGLGLQFATYINESKNDRRAPKR